MLFRDIDVVEQSSVSADLARGRSHVLHSERDIQMDHVETRSSGSSSNWKGRTKYWSVRVSESK